MRRCFGGRGPSNWTVTREGSRRIAALGSPVETNLRAGGERSGNVLVVAAVLRRGPFDAASRFYPTAAAVAENDDRSHRCQVQRLAPSPPIYAASAEAASLGAPVQSAIAGQPPTAR